MYSIFYVLVFLTSFFIGSLPISYWYGKIFKDIDLLQIGTKSVGSANLSVFAGKKASFFVAVLDFGLKGIIPLSVLGLLGFEEWVQIISGLLIVCGHNWSLFIKFKGGRGILTSLGIILTIGLWLELVLICILAGLVGRGLIYKDSGFWTFIGFFLLVMFVLIFNPDKHFVVFSSVLILMLIAKRLISNTRLLPGANIYRTLAYRLVFDRDVRSRSDWISGQSRNSNT